MAGHEMIVVNDLLSYLSSKLHVLSKDDLINEVTKFYSESDIQESYQTLISSLSINPLTKARLNEQVSNPVTAIYEYILMVPKNELPVFACKNLNNVPPNPIIKVEPSNEPFERPIPDFEKFKEEHNNMKTQINEMVSIVNQLNDQLQILLETTTLLLEDSSAKKIKFDIEGKDCGSPDIHSTSPKLKGLAYLQKLIDEENVDKANIPVKAENIISDVDVTVYQGFDSDIDNFGENPDEFATLEERNQVSSIAEQVVSEITLESTFDYQSSQSGNSSIDRLPLPLQCHVCCRTLPTATDFEDHMITHSAQSTFPCIFCATKFETSEELYLHFLECFQMSKNRLELEGKACFSCGFTCLQEVDLNTHSEVHSVAKPYFCEECDYRFISQKTLDIHRRKCHASCSFVCPLCKQTFGARSELNLHIRLHTGCKQVKVRKYSKRRKVYECPVCTKGFLDPDTLELHITKMHSQKSPVVCPICEKKIPHALYEIHLDSHKKKLVFKCPICACPEESQEKLRAHLLTHTSKGNLICQVCNREFKNAQGLKSHIKVHAGLIEEE